MKILVLCDEGNNRSVTLAHHLKYWGHDVIPAGVKRNSGETLRMLCEWADRVILTDRVQEQRLKVPMPASKLDIWDIGPDFYPRPFNPDLLKIVRAMMEDHKAEYKQTQLEPPRK